MCLSLFGSVFGLKGRPKSDPFFIFFLIEESLLFFYVTLLCKKYPKGEKTFGSVAKDLREELSLESFVSLFFVRTPYVHMSGRGGPPGEVETSRRLSRQVVAVRERTWTVDGVCVL